MKRALRVLLAALLASPASVCANPYGGEVVAGAAAIIGSGSSPTVTVNQTSDLAVINWQGFSIDAGQLTRFVQPSALSATLNRVTGGDPTSIYGTLQANGRVYVINPNGIAIGPTGVIDAQSFIASSLDVSDVQFMSGGLLDFAGGSQAGVANYGRISANGGDVFLLARTVRNDGSISAPHGTVGLASGSQILLKPAGDERVFIQAGSATSDIGVDQRGQVQAAIAELKAAGGNVYGLAVNNSGIVRAAAMTNVGGRIFLTATGGSVSNSGEFTATQGNMGGEVRVAGDVITLKGGSKIDVSGPDGGGTVLIGGDERDVGSMQRAQEVNVESGASIRADALLSGNGGKVVLWSDGAVAFHGDISARGGAHGGNGGFTEVSGLDLTYDGLVDLRAAYGDVGKLLIDPTDVTIGNSGDITPAALAAQLDAADTTVMADNSVTVADAVSWSSVYGLTLDAGNDIFINAGVTATAAGSLTLNSDAIALAADITTGGNQSYNGAVTLSGPAGVGVALLSFGGNVDFSSIIDSTIDEGLPHALGVDAQAGDVTFGGAVGGGTALDGLNVVANNIHLNGGAITTTGAQNIVGATNLGADTTLTSGAGDLTLYGSVDGAYGLTVNAGAGGAGLESVGNTTALSYLNASSDLGIYLIDGVTTSGSQAYNGPVVITGPFGGTGVGLASFAGNIDFAGAIDSTIDEGLPHALGVDAQAGDVTFGGAVGGGTALDGLNVVANNIHLNGGAITTTGAQNIVGATNLGADTTLTSGAGDLTLYGSVDGAYGLTVNAGAGGAGLESVGNTTALSYLNASSDLGIYLIDGVTTSGSQAYNGPVVITGPFGGTGVGLASFAGNIDFAGAIDSTIDEGLPHALGVDAQAGDVTFGGAVGGGTALDGLNVVANNIHLNGGAITTTGAQNIVGATNLGADTTLTSGAGDLTLYGSVDGAYGLTVNAGAGGAGLESVGNTTALSYLNASSDLGIYLIDGVTTSGSQAYNGPVVITGPFGGTGVGLASFAGNIDFAGAIDSTIDEGLPHALGVDAQAGDVTFGGAVGGGTALDGLNVVANNIHLNGGAITTTGAQNIVGATNLGADTTLTSGAGDLTLYGSVDGAYGLTVNAGAGGAGLESVGNTTALSYLNASSDLGIYLIDGVTTSGSQAYNGPVVITGPFGGTGVGLASFAGNIDFAGAIDSTIDEGLPHALGVDAQAGDVTFGGAVGGGTALDGLNVVANNIHLNGGAITTTGAQAHQWRGELGGRCDAGKLSGRWRHRLPRHGRWGTCAKRQCRDGRNDVQAGGGRD